MADAASIRADAGSVGHDSKPVRLRTASPTIYYMCWKTLRSKLIGCSIDMIIRLVLIALGWFIATTILAFVVLVCQSVYQAMVLGAVVEDVWPEPKVLAMVTVLTTLEIMAFCWLIRVKKDCKHVEPQTGNEPSIIRNEAPQRGSSRATTSTEIPCDQIDIATTLCQFPEIESVKESRGYPVASIINIKLKKTAMLSNEAAAAITGISNAKKSIAFVFECLTELSDSPEHVELAGILVDSQSALSEPGSMAAWDFYYHFNDLERIAPPIAKVFEQCCGRSHFYLNGIRELPELVADEFKAFSFETLELNGLVEVSSSVAGKICGDEVTNLSLDGIKTLNLEAAQAFAERFQGESISMFGLVELAPEVAKVLAEAKFTVVLSGSAFEEFQKHR